MSTFIVNANDTIVVLDSIIVKANKVVEVLQPVVKEAEPNGEDVCIAMYVCASVVLTVLIIAIAACVWRKQRKEEVLALEDKKHAYETAMKDKEHKHKNEEDDWKKNQYEHKLEKDRDYESKKGNYQKYEEFVEKMVNLAKSKDGSINEDVLNQLFDKFDAFKDKF